MDEVITSVGIDAHKRELHVAMLIGSAATPVPVTATFSVVAPVLAFVMLPPRAPADPGTNLT